MKAKSVFVSLFWFVVFLCVGVALHEAGHWLVAFSLGLNPRFGFDLQTLSPYVQVQFLSLTDWRWVAVAGGNILSLILVPLARKLKPSLIRMGVSGTFVWYSGSEIVSYAVFLLHSKFFVQIVVEFILGACVGIFVFVFLWKEFSRYKAAKREAKKLEKPLFWYWDDAGGTIH